MRKILFCLLVVASVSLEAQVQNMTLKKGVIEYNVLIKEGNGESFALYLPKSFNLDQNWPIVFLVE